MPPQADGAPLRILHVFRAPLGGLFRHVIDLAKGQIARGHAVGVFCDSTPGNAHSENLLGGLQPDLQIGLRRLPMKRNPNPSDLNALQALRSFISESRLDVVHCHGSKGGLYGRLATPARGANRPIRAYTPHGGSLNYKPDTWLHWLYMRAESFLERRTDLFLFESEYIRGRYVHYVGEPKPLVRVIRNGIHPHEFAPIEHQPDASDIVYVGEFREAKGIDVLIRAMAEARSRLGRTPTMVMVGSGPDLPKIKTDLAELGLTDAVTILPARPIRDALARGRVIVVASRAESLPYVVLEAAGAAQPMIATRVGGIGEVFGPWSDRLVPPGDIGALADALLRMLEMPEAQRAAEAAALAAHVKANFSVDGMIDGVLQGYRSAIDLRDADFVKASVTVGR
ncbi:glycosyltransferase [Terrarubrum flagellatum]|uniref:glycosyltransferase n=1 Tax=Terrirubrum flagellatum TaxID=2895980 RepID=UPI003145070F